ncbi:uncharacterized protein LOC132306066 isoform X2 [Cornus florida]|uniref:uncharacterized protein LOC132306066 isoform X2 n=1 Tax=Cornus florida TaxID=4283 RepID=UPI0028980A57|nr:uncharacterized protein LOC132306066 isoform X2 [Cornus florida]
MTKGVQLALENDKQKEVTATSVLSSRWRYLWTHYSRLDFDAPEMISEIYWTMDEEVVEAERVRYVKWVNWVVQLYRGSTIEEFRSSKRTGKRQQREHQLHGLSSTSKFVNVRIAGCG